MATFGTIPAFRPESDSIKPYLQRVKLYFTANSVEDDQKVAILLTSIGASTYDRLSDLLAPEDPSTKSFDQLTATLNKHSTSGSDYKQQGRQLENTMQPFTSWQLTATLALPWKTNYETR